MEQIRLENEQIEVTVNIHGAELRSLKSKADGVECRCKILGKDVTCVISICRRSKE